MRGHLSHPHLPGLLRPHCPVYPDTTSSRDAPNALLTVHKPVQHLPLLRFTAPRSPPTPPATRPRRSASTAHRPHPPHRLTASPPHRLTASPPHRRTDQPRLTPPSYRLSRCRPPKASPHTAPSGQPPDSNPRPRRPYRGTHWGARRMTSHHRRPSVSGFYPLGGGSSAQQRNGGGTGIVTRRHALPCPAAPGRYEGPRAPQGRRPPLPDR